MLHLRNTRAALAVTAASLACAAPAAAQAPAPQAPVLNTITVTGTGTVMPKPANRKSNASIVAAIEKAEAAATPRALADGGARAVRLAALSGMTLGALVAIAEAPPTPYGPFGAFPPLGSFGPDKYCGTIRRPVFRTSAGGKRTRVGTRTSRVCRVPPRVSATLALTFAAAPRPRA
ncbi:MAG: hypothetical protein LC744_00350 [Chloroflexi bacterium]|nr:hypothetical protein [Chloroflexota bacterium]